MFIFFGVYNNQAVICDVDSLDDFINSAPDEMIRVEINSNFLYLKKSEVHWCDIRVC